ncbi:hypothetical protein GCM10009636_17510 [Arthrobacter koreensis]
MELVRNAVSDARSRKTTGAYEGWMSDFTVIPSLGDWILPGTMGFKALLANWPTINLSARTALMRKRGARTAVQDSWDHLHCQPSPGLTRFPSP